MLLLRPRNDGSNSAADHIAATQLALAQLPKDSRRRVLIRADSGGGTHQFLDWLATPGRRLAYSVGFSRNVSSGRPVPAPPTFQAGHQGSGV